MDSTEERLKQVLKRLKKTRSGETICLMAWEVQMLLEHIENLKGGKDIAEVSAADRQGEVGGNGRWER